MQIEKSVGLLLLIMFISGCQPSASLPPSPEFDPIQQEDGHASSLPTNRTIAFLTLIKHTANSEYYTLTYWSDGLRINGFLGKPIGDGQYPAIIYNRGGYEDLGALEGWRIVPAVEAGFVTVASQYRGNAGSDGKDEFGGDDVNDVLALLPLLKKLAYVDPERIGMMGHSRGGMMTYLALKQDTLSGSNDIKAAVVVGGVADLFSLVRDQPMFLSMVGIVPEADPELYKFRSAVYWPALINTPLLIEHGEADEWVSVEQAKELAKVLNQNNKTVSLIIYPGEDHPLSGHAGGWPEALQWFQKYLGMPGEDLLFESHRKDIREVMHWFMTEYQR